MVSSILAPATMKLVTALLFLAFTVALAMVLTAVVIGTSAAWFLETPFMDGWHAAWSKPWVLFGAGIVFRALLSIQSD